MRRGSPDTRDQQQAVYQSRQCSDLPQIGEVLDAAKATVFLIDDNQVVRPGEVGTIRKIQDVCGQERLHSP
ncbi:DNA/RNA helicase domain-containing protein [Acidipila sp. EB88]|uniref:DNA/RNA helicase domain-containing protein n=1 Tax=Acidipila sp. EB88 TaxID=2305226 RepID=UPI000F5E5ED9|nr:DUF2075 domain-containing protein [Acidipila sp. EB88]